jgi:dienelactone hydrolase
VKGAAAIALSALALALAACGGSAAPFSTSHPQVSPGTPSTTVATTTGATTTATAPAPPKRAPSRPPHPPFAVGERVVTFVDSSRVVHFPGQAPRPRRLVTVVRYPARGPAGATDRLNAPPLRSAKPFPLVIFGHGFAVTPGPYAPLLQAWARAGYVVAAPIFPLGNGNAPGGPNEADLPNQPRDMSFVITGMLRASAQRGGFFAGVVNRREIAVTGQSDGGDTALAVAYDDQDIDRRVRAAVILSGAEIPGVGGFNFPPPSPPLLATQGTADTINPPYMTYAFFDPAPRPKYLLRMFGAPHLGPYTGEQPWQGIVERVTIAFLDHYLKALPGALRRMHTAAQRPGRSALQADP